VLLDGCACSAGVFCSLLAVPAADCEPAPTLLDGVWLLTGGVVAALLPVAELALEGAAWLEVSGAAAGALLLPVVLLDDAVELGFADIPLEACPPPVQESEIIFTEVTCSAPPLDWVPCTST